MSSTRANILILKAAWGDGEALAELISRAIRFRVSPYGEVQIPWRRTRKNPERMRSRHEPREHLPASGPRYSD